MWRIAVVLLLFLLGSGWLLRAAIPVFPAPVELPASTPVNLGIPLTRLELTAPPPITSESEAESVYAWFCSQESGALHTLSNLLAEQAQVGGWTALYAYANSDGSRQVLLVGNRGRYGSCRLSASGTLMSVDASQDERLPIIIPLADGKAKALSAIEAKELAIQLFRVREIDQSFFFSDRSPLDGPAQWRNSGSVWLREVRISTSPVSWMEGLATVSDVGTLSDFSQRSRRAYVCGCGTISPKRPPTVPVDEPEPPLPAANN